MFKVCQPELLANSLFNTAKGSSQLAMAYLGGQEYQPDANLNFIGDHPYDANENWSRSMSRMPMQDEAEQLEDSALKASDNEVGQMQRQKEASGLRNVPQGLNLESVFLASEEEEDELEEEEDEEEEDEEEEEDVRKPPEGAEGTSLDQEKTITNERTKESGKLASSPVEDNGYASSSLSIESPENWGTRVWDPPTGASEDRMAYAESQPPLAEAEDSPPPCEAFSPTLAEAFQNLQEKKKFKEQEKQKHRVHLVMYRRLALLRWIRSLQQKVVDQQNRLQESFDTILDNRKELIRCGQQGLTCSRNPAQGEL